MEHVRHDDRTTAYRSVERADGDRILLVHGSGATHGVWKGQLSRLSGDRPLAALDLSGHGESDDLPPGVVDRGGDPDGPTEVDSPAVLDAYARDVAAVADAVDARVIVGNSLGGAVALTGLLDHDLDADAVVLAGSGAKLGVAEELRTLLADDFERAIEVLHGDDLLFHDPDERTEATSREAMRAVGRDVTRRDFLACHTFDVRDRLDELDVPLFALTGEHDGLTPPSYHEYLAENVDDGEWTTVPDAAHLSMLERTDAFNDALREFLDG